MRAPLVFGKDERLAKFLGQRSHRAAHGIGPLTSLDILGGRRAVLQKGVAEASRTNAS